MKLIVRHFCFLLKNANSTNGNNISWLVGIRCLLANPDRIDQKLKTTISLNVSGNKSVNQIIINAVFWFGDFKHRFHVFVCMSSQLKEFLCTSFYFCENPAKPFVGTFHWRPWAHDKARVGICPLTKFRNWLPWARTPRSGLCDYAKGPPFPALPKWKPSPSFWLMFHGFSTTCYLEILPSRKIWKLKMKGVSSFLTPAYWLKCLKYLSEINETKKLRTKQW